VEVSEELRSYLDSVPFAALCAAYDLGHGPEAVLIIKSTEDVLSSLREGGGRVELGWVVEASEAGPVVCLVLRAQASGVADLLGEIYFDSSNPDDREVLALFSSQEAVRAVFLNEESQASWTAEIPWNELRRLESEQVADRAEELMERCSNADFETAKSLFQDRVLLDRLVARAFPAA
jgi:hypothetical protein